jgi:hypothetical protein
MLLGSAAALTPSTLLAVQSFLRCVLGARDPMCHSPAPQHRWIEEDAPQAKTGLGSMEFDSKQQRPQQQQPAPVVRVYKQQDGSSQASAGYAKGASKAAAGATDGDPLHDSMSEKEAEQLSALSRIIQQQQDTITKQVCRGAGGQGPPGVFACC